MGSEKALLRIGVMGALALWGAAGVLLAGQSSGLLDVWQLWGVDRGGIAESLLRGSAEVEVEDPGFGLNQRQEVHITLICRDPNCEPITLPIRYKDRAPLDGWVGDAPWARTALSTEFRQACQRSGVEFGDYLTSWGRSSYNYASLDVSVARCGDQVYYIHYIAHGGFPVVGWSSIRSEE